EVNRCGNPYHLRVPTADDLARLLTPFGSVRHYRQLDVVGSVVLADGDHQPAGSFASPVRNLPGDVRAVHLVICTKAPAGAVVPGPAPSLLLYRTFTDYQLGAHQHSWYLHKEQLHHRYRHWQEANWSQLQSKAQLRA